VSVPNLGRWIIYKESKRIITKYKYKGYKLRTKQRLSPTRLTNKLFLHTRTKCVRASETFCTSNLVFSTVVFWETTSTEHTFSVLLLVFCQIVSKRNSQVSVRIWWSVRRSWIPANPFLPSFWRTKKNIRRKLTGFGFSGLLYFPFLSCLNKCFVKVN